MADKSRLNLPQLSHQDLAKKVDVVAEYQKQITYQQDLDRRTTLATLRTPTSKTDSVNASGEMIIVDGTQGHYTYEFPLPDRTAKYDMVLGYLGVTYASGDVRKLVLTLNGTRLEGDFCGEETGGYGAEHYTQQRYGPFPLSKGKNTLCVTTDNFWFPHVHEIKVLDAAVLDQLEAEAAGEVTNRSLGGASNKPPPPKRTWIAPPSQPLKQEFENTLLRGFCSWEDTQEPNPNFVPDPSFYNAINCDGLWVCASKECGMKALHRACELVCRYVPIEIRRACLQWRAPKGRPIGPFRLVILDNRTNQCAGTCPEFPDSWGGRNGTSNPACFTSREDLDWNNNNNTEGPHGELTVHEMTHLIDMVVRQQIDPYFMQQVDDVWQANRNTYKKSYAFSDRHEYLAEIATLYVGCNSYNFKRGCAGCTSADSGCCDYPPHALLPPGPGGVDFRNKSDLLNNDPEGYHLLKAFLMEIHNPEDDTYWWQDQV